jgi:Cell Wall Hydrolase
MINTDARIDGGRGDRRYLRIAIWAGLLVYALYLSGSAWAGQVNNGAGLIGRWVAHEVTKRETVATEAKRRGFWSRLETEKSGRLAFRRPTLGDPRDEIACLALNIYHEARGEPDEGKLAVGHVVLNRVLSGRFPSTVCEVVQQGGEVRRNRCQFSWWCDGRSDTPRNRQDWQRSSELALAIYWGQTEDPTNGALWYHADYVSPAWRHDFDQGPTIGRHIFYLAKANQGYQVASRASGN